MSPRHFPVKSPVCSGLGELVGYEVWIYDKCEYRPTIKNRRYWWLHEKDRDLQPNDIFKFSTPMNAVIPGSIHPERESESYLSSELALQDKQLYDDYLSRPNDPEFVIYNQFIMRQEHEQKEYNKILLYYIEQEKIDRKKIQLQRRLITLAKKKGSYPTYNKIFKKPKEPIARGIVT